MQPKDVGAHGAHGAHSPKWVVQPDHKMVSLADRLSDPSGAAMEALLPDISIPIFPGSPRLFSMGDREVSRPSRSQETATTKAVKKQFAKLVKNMSLHQKEGG